MQQTVPFSIARAAHAEYVVTDIERAREFYVSCLGMIETERCGDSVYLRGIEDRHHHSLVLTQGDKAHVRHIAFRLSSEEDIDRAAAFLKSERIEFDILPEGEERGQGRAIRFTDPLGFPIELFHSMKDEEWKLQEFGGRKGACITRLDHFNLFVHDLEAALAWYGKLGFLLTEYTEDAQGRRCTAEVTRKATSHDLGLMLGTGPRLHHAGFAVEDWTSIYRFADTIASLGLQGKIERGPGRHGISNAHFLYVRDYDGHRIELYCGDYLILDPVWEPVRWRLDDPRRQTFWGSPVPESWKNEAMPVSGPEGGISEAHAPAFEPEHEEWLQASH